MAGELSTQNLKRRRVHIWSTDVSVWLQFFFLSTCCLLWSNLFRFSFFLFLFKLSLYGRILLIAIIWWFTCVQFIILWPSLFEVIILWFISVQTIIFDFSSIALRFISMQAIILGFKLSFYGPLLLKLSF